MSEVGGWEATGSDGDWGKVKNLSPSKGDISHLLWGTVGPVW